MLRLVILVFCVHKVMLHPVLENEGPSYWKDLGKMQLEAAIEKSLDPREAKNLILFIGDGMGTPTLTAARVYKGQLKGNPGEEDSLKWEEFSNLAAIKTYSADRQVPDSAATATALMCGIKTNYYTFGVDNTAKVNVCRSEQEAKVDCLMQWAQQEGKSTGVVTTTRITHATPGPTYAHTVNRDYEADSLIPKADRNVCKDIASQLIDGSTGRNLQVIFGGGAKYFYGTNAETPFGSKGIREDGRNLIEEWKQLKQANNSKFAVVSNAKELNQLVVSNTDYVLGLFNDDHMNYEIDRKKTPEGEPSLAEMTEKAIQILSKNPKGFVLMVEGGLIDIAHHYNWGKRALTDTIALEKAVETAIKLVNANETLITVTADHSHAMSISGYPDRGNDIFGIGGISDVDFLPYTTIMYTSGLGYNNTDGHRPNLTNVNTSDINYRQLATIPDTYAYHGGEDVLLYATGPKSDLFYGLKEQHYVAHALAYAAGLNQCGVTKFVNNDESDARITVSRFTNTRART